MAYVRKPVILKWDNNKRVLDPGSSFEDLLDVTCDRLREKQVAHSIRHIIEMEEVLLNLEKELDKLIELKTMGKKINGQ